MFMHQGEERYRHGDYSAGAYPTITNFCKPDRIALNPDWGFCSRAAEPPTIEEAFGKLKLLLAAAAVLREGYPEARRSSPR
jgi:methionine synthase II (cobalamin-independent)